MVLCWSSWCVGLGCGGRGMSAAGEPAMTRLKVTPRTSVRIPLISMMARFPLVKLPQAGDRGSECAVSTGFFPVRQIRETSSPPKLHQEWSPVPTPRGELREGYYARPRPYSIARCGRWPRYGHLRMGISLLRDLVGADDAR